MTELSTAERSSLATLPGVVTVVAPAKRRLGWRSLIAALPVIRVLAARDFKAKYKQSLLGPAWLVIQPLALLGALIVAFSSVVSVETEGVPYVVFALSGLAAWAFFQAAFTMGGAAVVSNYQLVKRTSCPRVAFPIAGIIASLPSLALTGAAAIAAAALSGNVGVRLLLAPVVVVWLLALTFGAVALVAALAVRYRDVLSVLPFALQVGFFVTPVGFPPSELSGTMRTIVSCNPMTGVLEAWRWTLISGWEIDGIAVWASLIITVAALVLGFRVFARLEVSMADDI